MMTRHFAKHYIRAGVAAIAVAAIAGACQAGELDAACARALGGRSGRIVVLDVTSGRVVGSASSDKLEKRYPAGSVAKLACAHAGLLGGNLTSRTSFTCRGAKDIGGRRFHCTVPGGHGPLELAQAMSKSCNIWFYQAAARVPASATMRSWRMLGVGGASGSKNAADAAVGRGGPQVTASEMALVARTIAVSRDRPGSPCKLIGQAMERSAVDGTAYGLASARVRCAVKTGSPEHVNNPKLRHGWVIGYAPADRPKYAFAVFCLEGNAFRSAVPVTKALLDGIFMERTK